MARLADSDVPAHKPKDKRVQFRPSWRTCGPDVMGFLGRNHILWDGTVTEKGMHEHEERKTGVDVDVVVGILQSNQCVAGPGS